MAAIIGTLPAQTAGGATSTTYLGTNEIDDGSGTGISVVVLTPPAGYSTVTGVATNNVTFNFRQVRAGSAVATFATVTLGSGTNLVAEIPLNVPITSGINLLANDVVDVQMVQNGTGLAVNVGVSARVEVN